MKHSDFLIGSQKIHSYLLPENTAKQTLPSLINAAKAKGLANNLIEHVAVVWKIRNQISSGQVFTIPNEAILSLQTLLAEFGL